MQKEVIVALVVKVGKLAANVGKEEDGIGCIVRHARYPT